MDIGKIPTKNEKKINSIKKEANSSKLMPKKRNKKRVKKNRNKKIKKTPIVLFLIFVSLIYYIFLMNNKVYNNIAEKENMFEQDFISKIEKKAEEEYIKNGILPSITISQAILESNWGESRLALEGNNLFGIKADKSWHGKRINFSTKENYKDYVKADFRKYSSWDESISDYANFLKENNRYKKHGLFDSKDYVKQAQSLEDAGYATTENEKGEKIYAEKLIGVIKKYNLRKYDIKAINRKN